IGKVFCHSCGQPVEKQSVEQIIDILISKFNGKRILILAPVVKGRKGEYKDLFEDILKDGFIRVRVDGEIKEIEKGFKVDRYKIHDIEIIIDRLQVSDKAISRITESIEVAMNYGNGNIIINDLKKDIAYSRNLFCSTCQVGYQELAPNSFSFNSPYGYCPDCEGLGVKKEINIDLIISDMDATINEGGITAIGKPRNVYIYTQLEAVAKHLNFDFNTKIKELSKEQINIILYGSKEKIPIEYSFKNGRSVTYYHRFNGVVKYVKNYYDKTTSNNVREWAESFMSISICQTCNGGRLRKESLAVKINELSISDITALSIKNAYSFFENIKFTDRENLIARQIIKEIKERLSFLLNVGVDYLTLNRAANTLAGGEAQRIRLATQIGTQLAGVLYVLDEPSIGLHQSDNIKLINSLKNLRDLGNTIIVVEHDKETIINSDYIVDLGPGAGEHGGQICLADFTKKIIKKKTISNSLTANYINNQKSIEIPKKRRKGNGKFIELFGAKGNNLKNIHLKIPLGTFICITGVSGSGKSSLINDTLGNILKQKFYNSKILPLKYDNIKGLKEIDKVIEIDQQPIGRTPRSNPATYTGLFSYIRDLFAQLPEAKMRGYKTGRFSFNVKSGRCEECQGGGMKKIEMNFLPDVYVICEECNGNRYNRETLEILFKTKSISDVLNMNVESALDFFNDQPRIKRKLQSLNDVGLGYIKLGQQATTLSGGEAQRVKLATELSKVSTGKTLYMLDEPTTGLHFEDVKILLKVLNDLVDKGNTVIVVEHNMEVIKFADYIIDLGPGGGEYGGKIVVEGTPERIVKNPRSITAKYLINELKN
ncbi:MAG: excinuclease ABC subunit UvrA, partial [Ignavibacteriales bacterium]|nr:excinuclease ABC subunit UvrA [Ignavibacteriales bacterium]